MAIALNKEKAFKEIIDKRGTAYTTGIIILEDLIKKYNKYLSASTKLEDIKWRIDYDYYKKFFGFESSKTKNALRILSKRYGLINIKTRFAGGIIGGSESIVSINEETLKNLLLIENIEKKC